MSRARQPSARTGAGPLGGGDLTDVAGAATCLRREADARGRFRAALAVAVGAVIAAVVYVGHLIARGTPPAGWVALALGAASWLGLAIHARRVAHADAAEADRLRAVTVLRTRPGNEVVVRDTTGSAWRWRHRPTARPLEPGERAWLGCCGPLQEAPHLVMAHPVRPGRYVVWAATERSVDRLPDPAGDHDAGPLPTVFVDEPDS